MQADLRRAISNADYALFHEVLTAVADTFVGKTRNASPQYALAYRSIDHRALRALCEEIKKPTMPAKYTNYLPRGGFGPDLVAMANAVVELQEKRHSADYDPLFRVGMSDATLAVATSRTALNHFRSANRTSRKAFLALLAFPPR